MQQVLTTITWLHCHRIFGILHRPLPFGNVRQSYTHALNDCFSRFDCVANDGHDFYLVFGLWSLVLGLPAPASCFLLLLLPLPPAYCCCCATSEPTACQRPSRQT